MVVAAMVWHCKVRRFRLPKSTAACACIFAGYLLKATVDLACASLSDAGYDVSPHPDVPTALCITGRTAGLQTTETYAEGLIELQDAHSQASVTLLDPKQNGPILDYCAVVANHLRLRLGWGAVHA